METGHFELISEAGRSRTLEIAERLELFRALLGEVGIASNLEPRVPLLVFVFADARSFSRFGPRTGLDGFTLPRAHRSYLVLHAGGDSDARETALHEYVHFVLRNGEATHYPAWYDEGLAEFLSTVVVEDGRVLIGRVPASRARWLLHGSPLSLRRVMTVEDVDEWSGQALDRFGAQAWAIAYFFHVPDRAGSTSRRDQMTRYIELLNRGEGPDDAFRRAFGADFEQVEPEFMAWLGRGELQLLGLPLGQLPAPDAASVSALSGPERDRLLGELALALGPSGREEAAVWLRRAARGRPDDARTQAALGRALARSDPAAADAAFARALELGEQDAVVQRLHGEQLLERAEQTQRPADDELVEAARRAFRRSIALDPEQVAAYAGLGRTFLAAPGLGDPAEGLAALRTAHERLPGNRAVLLGLAQLEASRGNRARARALLARLPLPSHGDPAASAEGPVARAARRAAGLPDRAPRATRHLEVRLDVARPGPDTRVRGLFDWVEVSGRGGLFESTYHDVVIAFDQSSSTLAPTGVDLDGDGDVGRALGRGGEIPEDFVTDPDDAVIGAELAATRALIRELDPRTTRVAVVAFAGGATTIARLGDPDVALDALDAYAVRVDRSGTSLTAALNGALHAFALGRDLTPRQRTILLLSDGQPTTPNPHRARRDALALADELGRIGVPVQALAIGESALAEPDFYRSLAERTGGRFIAVDDPADVPRALAGVRLTGLENVSIESTPAGAPARAVRVFPDGSFDAYAPLVEGENEITITASIEGGRSLRVTRRVFWERPAHPSVADEREATRRGEDLERRALERDLLQEIRSRRPDASRRLEVEVEQPDAPSADP